MKDVLDVMVIMEIKDPETGKMIARHTEEMTHMGLGEIIAIEEAAGQAISALRQASAAAKGIKVPTGPPSESI